MHSAFNLSESGGKTAADAAWETLLALAKALNHVGLPSHEVEAQIRAVAERLGIQVEVLSVPTGLILTFFSDSGRPVTMLTRETPAALNLELLDEVVQIADSLGRNREPLSAVASRLQSILRRKPRWGWLSVLAAYILSSCAFGIFFQGGLREVLMAAIVGLVVGIVSLLLRRVRVSSRLFELLAALGASFVIYSCEPWLGEFEEWIPMAAGLIILLPGVALVDAVNELANGHVLAGGSRMAGVAVAFLALTFGTVSGLTLAKFLPGPHLFEAPASGLPLWAPYAAVGLVGLGSLIRFRAHPSQLLIIMMASAVSLVASRMGRHVFGDLPGAFLAALTLALLGNFYSLLCRHAAEIFTIPGLAVLVPGSVGVRSMRLLLSNDTTAGLAEALQMLLVAMALVAGFLFSNSIWQALMKPNPEST